MAYPQRSFISTTFAPDSFLARKRNVVWRTTLLYQLKVLKDTGRYDAFKLKHHPIYDEPLDHWPVPAHLFWDSDIAKWIEGACYFLHEQSNAEIEYAVQELCEMIASAQQPDGFLNIHYTVVEPGKRFTNLRDMHELYNAGHLIEAAIAHQHLRADSILLKTLIKYVDLLCQIFGPADDQKHGYPGHPEIEFALLRLYAVTGDAKHLHLAAYFIDERGNPKGSDGRHYYDVECEARHESPWQRPNSWPMARSYWYQQAHKPILEQDTIEGHSVRAMYLLTAVADLERYREHDGYRAALVRLWDNMVEKKMYLTGGIGAMDQWEGFGIDYFLPQSTDEGGCYAETCASIGVMMMAERLLQIDLNGRYADIMELAFFNTVLGGMSCNDKREEWFTCACCPPNVTRTLGFLGGYLWTFKEDASKSSPTADIHVHLYGSAKLIFDVGEHSVSLKQESDWPWEGEVKFQLEGAEVVDTNISLRIPGWAQGWKLSPGLPGGTIEKGYLHLPAEWLRRHPQFMLRIAVVPRLLSPHPFTNQDVVAVARGPLIYCLEDVDNTWVDDHFTTLLFDTSASISETPKVDVETGESYMMLVACGPFSFLNVDGCSRPSPGISPDAADAHADRTVDQLHFVPYYYRANRKSKGHMRVGMRRARS